MLEGRSVLAVVPARGGSKGIARKNLCRVGGLSLIARAAAVARALPWIDRAVLSTDDAEMADEGRRYHLEVPFLRPAELAADDSLAVDMWRHAWLASEAHYGCSFDLSVLLQPTTPLRRPEEVERTARALIESRSRAAATVSRVPAHFTPEKIMVMDGGGRLRPYRAHGPQYANRQDIPPYWYRNGTCYAVTREALVQHGTITEDDCVGVAIDGFVVNIDEPVELELAEFFVSRS